MEMRVRDSISRDSVDYRPNQVPFQAQQSPDRTLWAKVPFQSKEGRCVALRMSGGTLLVGIAAAPAPRWLPVEKVMNEADAKAWLMSGFS